MSDVGILTLSDDLHAYIVRHRLEKNHGISARIIEVDKLAGHGLNWSSEGKDGIVPAIDGPCDVSALRVMWWRRARADQADAARYPEDAGDLINQDWRASLRGTVMSSFAGSWVSHPENTERASFKIPQLELARSCGFAVPETLVSNSPARVREFASRFPGGAVVKAVAGTRHALLVAKHIHASDLPDDEIIAVCPSIYQEHIAGDTHLRVNAFGSEVHIFEIVSDHMDWRPDLTNNIRHHPGDSFGISQPILSYLEAAGLAMGVFDLKIDRSGRPVFLEINPQGQFLFLEGISGYPIGDRFAEFVASLCATSFAAPAMACS